MGLSDKVGREGTGKGKWKSLHKVLSWREGPSDSIRDTIASITDNGAAILFSRTPDGGALVLKIFSGTDSSKEYITEPGDFVPLLAWCIETYG